MNTLRINGERLLRRLWELGQVGALEGGGVCRLALTDADREGRDLVVRWMRELGLTVTVDRIGNVVGLRAGRIEGPPVMTGSHIDTVATGGLYDGNLGVLAVTNLRVIWYVPPSRQTNTSIGYGCCISGRVEVVQNKFFLTIQTSRTQPPSEFIFAAEGGLYRDHQGYSRIRLKEAFDAAMHVYKEGGREAAEAGGLSLQLAARASGLTCL